DVVAERTPEPRGEVRVGQQPDVVVEADELPDAAPARSEQAEAERIEQREDHERAVQRDRRPEEDDEVPRERPPRRTRGSCHAVAPSGRWTGSPAPSRAPGGVGSGSAARLVLLIQAGLDLLRGGRGLERAVVDGRRDAAALVVEVL